MRKIIKNTIIAFQALLGGVRYYDGMFYDVGYGRYWWRLPAYANSTIYKGGSYNKKISGFSFRCLRD